MAPGVSAAAPGHPRPIAVGEPCILKGGADVRWLDLPAAEGERAGHEDNCHERRAAVAAVSEEEIARSGLFQPRTFEVAESREQPVVATEAFVREELVVRKSVEERVETIDEIVRHTEVEVERLAARPGAHPADGMEVS